jgi:hypothetical protein
MGVPTDGKATRCQASDLIRDKEVAVFTDDTLKFSLTDLLSEVEINNLAIDRRNMELFFDNMSRIQPEKRFFWKLPVPFIGNKLGSYGGYLTFTLSQSSRYRQKQVQVVIRGNGIQLDHFANVTGNDGRRMLFTIPIHESQWKRDDGLPADREHLLMALADLTDILIEALDDSRSVERVGIKDVSLTISHEGVAGNELASSVEQCTCPAGTANLHKFALFRMV